MMPVLSEYSPVRLYSNNNFYSKASVCSLVCDSDCGDGMKQIVNPSSAK